MKREKHGQCTISLSGSRFNFGVFLYLVSNACKIIVKKYFKSISKFVNNGMAHSPYNYQQLSTTTFSWDSNVLKSSRCNKILQPASPSWCFSTCIKAISPNPLLGTRVCNSKGLGLNTLALIINIKIEAIKFYFSQLAASAMSSVSFLNHKKHKSNQSSNRKTSTRRGRL